jgi:hypothetical protein
VESCDHLELMVVAGRGPLPRRSCWSADSCSRSKGQQVQVRRSARCRRSGARDPVPLSNAGRAVITFPVIYGISPVLMEFQFEVSAHTIPQDVAHVIPQLGMSVSPLVWFSQGVSRYTNLATQVRQACGIADG